MVTGWFDFFGGIGGSRAKKEFVSVDARLPDHKKEPRSYEMLSRDSAAKEESVLTPVSPTSKNQTTVTRGASGRRTPDYFQSPGYQPHARSFSAPRAPQQPGATYQQAGATTTKTSYVPPQQTMQTTPAWTGGQQSSNYWAKEDGQTAPPTTKPIQHRREFSDDYEDMNPLGMNRI